MSTLAEVVAEPISVAELEALWDDSVPCGGVQWLGIPPCGAEAELRLDRTHPHSRIHPSHYSADFKCGNCYEKWRSEIQKIIKEIGYITCHRCGKVFRTVEDFARYVPLG